MRRPLPRACAPGIVRCCCSAAGRRPRGRSAALYGRAAADRPRAARPGAARQLQPDRPAARSRKSAHSRWSPARATTRTGCRPRSTATATITATSTSASPATRSTTRTCPPSWAPPPGRSRSQIKPVLGPLFHLGQVTLTGEPTTAAREALQLKSGDPAVAANVLAARDRMLHALRVDGHALAKVEPAGRRRSSRPTTSARRVLRHHAGPARRYRPDHDQRPRRRSMRATSGSGC